MGWLVWEVPKILCRWFFIRVPGGTHSISKVHAVWLGVAGGQCKQQPVAVACISGVYAFFSHALDPIFLLVAWDLRYVSLFEWSCGELHVLCSPSDPVQCSLKWYIYSFTPWWEGKVVLPEQLYFFLLGLPVQFLHFTAGISNMNF